MGCTENNSKAERNVVAVNEASTKAGRVRAAMPARRRNGGDASLPRVGLELPPTSGFMSGILGNSSKKCARRGTPPHSRGEPAANLPRHPVMAFHLPDPCVVARHVGFDVGDERGLFSRKGAMKMR